ncbi:MAG: peptidoglycan D,D-transpeptidase FtsI family protein [Wujia sp.]
MAKKRKRRRFLAKMKKRLLIAVAAFIAVFAVLAGRLVYINLKKGDEYEQRVLAQQGYTSTTIPYRRGDILDANGTVLATSKKVYNLILEPKNILEKDAYKEATIPALKKYFDITDEEMADFLENEESYYVVARKKLEYDKVKAFNEFCDSEEGSNIRGVYFEENYQRVYPNDELACHLLGFTVSGNVGMYGVEEQYNSELNGSNGREYSYLNEDQSLTKTIEPAVNGYNLITNIDANVQQVVQEKVDAFMNEYGAKNVSVLVMDPKDCSVMAMYNSHSYNPNDAYDLDYTRYQFDSDEEFENFKLTATDDEKVDALYKVWRNFAISDVYEPGSTYKTFTIAGALQEGVVNQNNTFVCDGYEMKDIYTIRCSHTHGTITLSQALEYSCNDALMQIGEMEGAKIFDKYQVLFGFGQQTNIDIPGEPDEDSLSMLVYHENTLNEVELATSSFGQGVTVSMIELGTAFCSAINGGYYYEPRVVKRIEDENGNVIENLDSVLVRRTVSEDVSSQLRQSLKGVVEEGTGGSAAVDGYSIGGKTGTAEKIPRNQGNYLLSFIGFSPIDDPQVVIYVVVDEPHDEEIQSMSGSAKHIFADVAAEIFPYLNIYKTGEEYDYDPEMDNQDQGGPIYEGITPENDVAGGADNPYVSGNGTSEGGTDDGTGDAASTEDGTGAGDDTTTEDSSGTGDDTTEG